MTRSIVVMGVAGSGKSTLGPLLANELELPFVEGDDFHDASSREKMASGTPLTDADRLPWLSKLRLELDRGPTVLACSALKQSYRDQLGDVDFIYLRIEPEETRVRLARRTSAHFPPELVDSQFEILEEPEDALWVHALLPPEIQLEIVLSKLAKL